MDTPVARAILHRHDPRKADAEQSFTLERRPCLGPHAHTLPGHDPVLKTILLWSFRFFDSVFYQMREWGQPLEVHKVRSAVDIQKYLSRKPPSVLAINSFEDNLQMPSMLVSMLQAPLHQPRAPCTSSLRSLPVPLFYDHVCTGDARVPLSSVCLPPYRSWRD